MFKIVALKVYEIFCLQNTYVGECFSTSCLPGKALRMCVESRGLPSDSTCILKAEPGKFDIKRRKPGMLFISLQVGLLVNLAIMT